MFNLTAEYVKKQLDKVAFFIQYSDVLHAISDRIRNVIEDDALEIAWVSAKLDSPEDWKQALVEGDLKGQPLKIMIKRNGDKYTYEVFYQSKKYISSNLKKLKELLFTLKEEKTPKLKNLQLVYRFLSTKEDSVFEYIKNNYLKYERKEWDISLVKDPHSIRVRIYLNDPQEKNLELSMVKQNLPKIIEYLKLIMRRGGLDISDISFEEKLIKSPNQIGFLIVVS